jgi:enamine deaminase RidA (YjgF/YER057c/UK114 family)
MAKPINIGIAANIGKYSDAVVIERPGRQLHVSGTPGMRKDGTLPSDFAGQADLAWQNLTEILQGAGMGVQNLVKINQYLLRAEDIALYGPIRIKYLGIYQPASMLSIVSALVRPGILFEIEAIAAD